MNQDRYLIKDLENLTGIKAHTIRIWESRYDLLSPKRSETNIRFYEDEDLKKILNINLLYQNGYKISKIAKLTEINLIEEVSGLIERNQPTDLPIEIDLLTRVVLALDSDGIIEIIEELETKHGMINLYQTFLKPFLVRMGELWQLNTMQIAHEHLFSNTLRSFIINKTSTLERPKINKTALLFLPEKEEHELTLLFYNYLLTDKGWTCIYLGQKVPIEHFETAYLQKSPDIVVTSLIKSTSSKQFKNIISKILKIVPKNKIYLSGSNTITYIKQIPKSISTIHNLADFTKIFD